jgi:hypothetical protein
MTELAVTARRCAVVVLGSVVLLGAVVPARAAGDGMPAADRAAIGRTVDRFVKDVLLRHDLADGWALAGPQVRGGTTRSAWVAGTGVTVEAFPARGTDFTHAWTGKLVGPGDAVLAMVLHPRPHTAAWQTAFSIDVRKVRGRWVVDAFYPAATFRSTKGHQGSCGRDNCAISGPADFGPSAGDSAATGATQGHVGARSFLLVLAGIGAIVVLAPLGVWVGLRRRNRRATAAYLAARRG